MATYTLGQNYLSFNKLKLEKTEWTITNGNNGYARHEMKTNKTKQKTQRNMCWAPLCTNKNNVSKK